jgi:hypothetical protein
MTERLNPRIIPSLAWLVTLVCAGCNGGGSQPPATPTPTVTTSVSPTPGGNPGPAVIIFIPRYTSTPTSIHWESPEGVPANPSTDKIPDISSHRNVRVYWGPDTTCNPTLLQEGTRASHVIIDHPSAEEDVVITGSNPSGTVVQIKHCAQADPANPGACSTAYPQFGPNSELPVIFFHEFTSILTDSTPLMSGLNTLCKVQLDV